MVSRILPRRLSYGAFEPVRQRMLDFQRVRSGLPRVLLCLGVLTLIGCSAGESVKLTGYVLSSKTDENDNPVDIYLFDGTTEYPIEKNDSQEKLLDLVDQKVQIEGTLGSSFGGKKSVTIERFKRLEE